MTAFYAHSTPNPDRSDWQLLAEHLRNTASGAALRASVFGAAEVAHVEGLLHDIGKYTEEFQRRIAGDAIRVDHATRGAMLAVERYGKLGQLMAYAIAGHHSGLANGVDAGERSALRDRLRGDGLPRLSDLWEKEVTLPDRIASPAGFKGRPDRGMFQLAFLVRMLFSCLVDADYLDTEAFYDRVEGRLSTRNASAPTLAVLRERLNSHLSRFEPDSQLNKLRTDILQHVRRQSDQAQGLFSLTVPTGGGKTLTSLAFALDHAIRHGLRRVIFVIPFTSIVEQNAAVFREAFGELGDISVLEHHSALAPTVMSRDAPDRYQAKEKLRLAMENWEAPIVVTTAVQFFESLFAAKPSQCRKLHNIAGSVVILDEAQTLPLKLLRPCVAAIDELACNYRCSVVLCTATQPALQAPKFDGGLEGVRELAPDPPRLFRKLERVRVRHAGVLDDAALADEMRSRDQVLCIVNNRGHARAVYQALADLPGARHLTTLMCARHRSEALAEIRAMLKRGDPCRLVATSLIEAGVDVSFPTVLRAEAGLDSIAQAAGRCNRNGEWPVERSEVLVFANVDWAPPPDLKQFADAARETLRAHGGDPLSPPAIEAYFRRLYWQKGDQQLDAANLLGKLMASQVETLPLEMLAAKFRMIDSVLVPVIVPYGDDGEARALVDSLHHVDRAGGIARRLQRYLVQIPDKAFAAMLSVGAIQPVARERWGDQFVVLENSDLYDQRFGLKSDDPTFVKAERLMW